MLAWKLERVEHKNIHRESPVQYVYNMGTERQWMHVFWLRLGKWQWDLYWGLTNLRCQSTGSQKVEAASRAQHWLKTTCVLGDSDRPPVWDCSHSWSQILILMLIIIISESLIEHNMALEVWEWIFLFDQELWLLKRPVSILPPFQQKVIDSSWWHRHYFLTGWERDHKWNPSLLKGCH